MAASSISDRCDSGPLTLENPIMFAVLEWLLDISLAVTGAAATGSIFFLLVELAKVAHRRFVLHRIGARLAINADATN
jgi:hypothetical protein